MILYILHYFLPPFVDVVYDEVNASTNNANERKHWTITVLVFIILIFVLLLLVFLHIMVCENLEEIKSFIRE